jgi:hypothetical protein
LALPDRQAPLETKARQAQQVRKALPVLKARLVRLVQQAPPAQ